MSAPVFFGHWLYSFHSRVQPNWIAAAVPPMFCLMAVFWHERQRRRKTAARRRPGRSASAASAFMYDSDLLGKLAGNTARRQRPVASRARLARNRACSSRTNAKNLMQMPSSSPTITARPGFIPFIRRPPAPLRSRPTAGLLPGFRPSPINQFYFWDEYNYRKHRQGQNAIFVHRLEPYQLEPGWIWKWLRHEPIQLPRIPPPVHPAPTASPPNLKPSPTSACAKSSSRRPHFPARATLRLLPFEIIFTAKYTKYTN